MLKSFLKKLSKRDRRRPSRPGAMNFVTGDKGLGSSVVSVAKNNISRFNRVENAVPQQSLVSQLIPNISNPIERKGSKEDTNFISEYLDFFGSKKTAKTFKENLTFIKKSLTNTFEIAKILRVAIKNIVDQLKGLQGADGGGGIFGNLLKTLFSGLSSLIGGLVGTIVTAILGKLGLKNLAKIFKKTAPDAVKGSLKGNKLFSRMGKFGKFGLIAGGLGLGGIAISNLLGNENMDKFGNILNKFERAIDSLMGKKDSDSDLPPPLPNLPSVGPGEYSPGTIPKSVSQDTAFTEGVTRLAKKYKMPEDYLYAVMGFETGGTFSPSIQNPKSKATGLIQFTSSTAKGLGTTTDKLAKMTRAEQLEYVDKHFSNKNITGGSLSDLYMSVLFPAAVGESDDFVLFGSGATRSGYGAGSKAYEQNKGLDINKDGSVTKAEATSKVEKYLPQTLQRQGPRVSVVPLPAQRQAVEQPSSIISPQQEPGGGAPTATFLGSSNPDTAHAQLATRSTLNITE